MGRVLKKYFSTNISFGVGNTFIFRKPFIWIFTELTNASDFTISGNYTVGNLTIIPEFRIDTNDEDVFLDSDGAASSSLASFVLAFAYGF